MRRAYSMGDSDNDFFYLFLICLLSHLHVLPDEEV